MSEMVQVIRVGRGVIWGTPEEARLAAQRSDREQLLDELRGVLPVPLRPGETLVDWRRLFYVSETSPAQHARVEAAIARVLRGGKARQVAARAAWVAGERTRFARPALQPCSVCGGHADWSELHHVYPLGLQFDAGRTEADHSVVSLCAQHHREVHVYLNDLVHGRANGARAVVPDESRRITDILVSFIELSGWEEVR